jgi:CRISPR/Cas system-associated exonuclease Cas4 (RecB family)
MIQALLEPDMHVLAKSKILGQATGQLTSWSFSKLEEARKCKYRTWLLHIARVPEPERALPPGKTEHANDRGSRVHTGAEDFVRGKTTKLLPELNAFRTELAYLTQLHASGMVSMEGEWGFDAEWNITDWDKAWGRMKLDVIVLTKTHAVLIDYKTGRREGNELKHGEQIQLYQLGAFMRYSDLETVDAELWYTDVDDITHMHFTREQGLKFKHKFTKRANELLETTQWPANPNKYSCAWCQYKERIGGPCKVGVG